MAVRAEPSMVPVPFTASIAVMSEAPAIPAESVELKLVGDEVRAACASTMSSAEPLIAVIAVPTKLPVVPVFLADLM